VGLRDNEPLRREAFGAEMGGARGYGMAVLRWESTAGGVTRQFCAPRVAESRSACRALRRPSRQVPWQWKEGGLIAL